MLLVCFVVVILSVYLMNSSYELLGLVGVLFGFFFVSIYYLLYRRSRRERFSNKIDSSKLARELLLSLIFYLLITFNCIFSYESWSLGFGVFGPILLMVSVLLPILSAWKKRFAFLFVFMLGGVGLIEIGV